MVDFIEPRTLKGFRDALPDRAVRLERMTDAIRDVLRLNGFAPIRTPVLEFEEILRGKGGEESERQMYTFTDPGNRRVGLRFDLTVPLARFVSQHEGQLQVPMNLYQCGPVWRGENTQRGRSREFVQFDFDTLGADSALADAQILVVAHHALRRAGAPAFTIRVNSRLLLADVLDRCGIGAAIGPGALRSVDKLRKIGEPGVLAELAANGIDDAAGRRLLEMVQLHGPFGEVLDRLGDAGLGDSDGARRLGEVGALLDAAGIAADQRVIDLSIARGLDYYTGIVFETTLDGAEAIGSVCSGGRYDRLTSLFSRRPPVVGVGGSIGVDRLLDAIEETSTTAATATGGTARAFALFLVPDGVDPSVSLAVATAARAAGVPSEVYSGSGKLRQQQKFAAREHYPADVTIGLPELAGRARIRLPQQERSVTVDVDEVVATLSAAMSATHEPTSPATDD